MIHGQLIRRKLAAAMVANAARTFALPPLALAQLACLLPFATDFGFGYFDKKGRRFHRQLLSIPPFEIFKVNSKSPGDDEIQAAPPRRRSLTAGVVSILPSAKEYKENYRAGNQYFVSSEEFHRQPLINHSETALFKCATRKSLRRNRLML